MIPADALTARGLRLTDPLHYCGQEYDGFPLPVPAALTSEVLVLLTIHSSFSHPLCEGDSPCVCGARCAGERALCLCAACLRGHGGKAELLVAPVEDRVVLADEHVAAGEGEGERRTGEEDRRTRGEEERENEKVLTS